MPTKILLFYLMRFCVLTDLLRMVGGLEALIFDVMLLLSSSSYLRNEYVHRGGGGGGGVVIHDFQIPGRPLGSSFPIRKEDFLCKCFFFFLKNNTPPLLNFYQCYFLCIR